MSEDVTCSARAWEAVERHMFSNTDREVGGILVGTVADGRASVTGTLPALAATSGSANVTFTHEVWEQVHAAMDRDHSDERIVGWYHSHPGFGVFLSEYDAFAHRNFFEDAAMLALVVDPHSGEAGWFAMRDGAPTLVATRSTDTPPLRPAGTPVASAAGAARRSGLAVPVALAVAAAVIGFFVGGSVSTRTVVAPAAQAAPAPPSPTAPQVLPAAAPAPAALAPPAAAPAPARPVDAAIAYRVRRGDTLWALSGAFYGDPSLWVRLLAANPQLADERLEVGARLRVPVELGAVR